MHAWLSAEFRKQIAGLTLRLGRQSCRKKATSTAATILMSGSKLEELEGPQDSQPYDTVGRNKAYNDRPIMGRYFSHKGPLNLGASGHRHPQYSGPAAQLLVTGCKTHGRFTQDISSWQIVGGPHRQLGWCWQMHITSCVLVRLMTRPRPKQQCSNRRVAALRLTRRAERASSAYTRDDGPMDLS